LWLPASLRLGVGVDLEVFLPVLYPASHEHADDQVKLARVTEWSASEERPLRGSGGRVFLCGDRSVNLLDLRKLVIIT